MAYFDWNATTPLLPQARTVWLEASDRYYANPSTSYRMGVQARLALEEAREKLAGLVGVSPGRVIFTSGATEANNTVLRGCAAIAPAGSAVWVSAGEHPSVKQAAYYYWGNKRVLEFPISKEGLVDMDWLAQQLRNRPPALLCLMAANNETGVLQPWKQVHKLCREAAVPVYCDAVQWFGKRLPEGLGNCQGLALSGHKFGGPKGVGCLILSPEWNGIKLMVGGAQELDRRAGTENIPAVLAMVEALRVRDSQLTRSEFPLHRNSFESDLETLWPGKIRIHGKGAPRLPNTCSVALPEFRADRWIASLDRVGFQVSSGSACSTGKAGPSPVLKAMGVPQSEIQRTIRISSGWESTAADWEGLLGALAEVRQILQRSAASSGPGMVIEL